MFTRVLRHRTKINQLISRSFGVTKSNCAKVTVIGASGGIGAPLCLLLKLQPDLVSEINMHDVAKHNPGVALDLSHINYPVKIKAYTGPGELNDSLRGADVVIIPGGVPRKPGMTRDDLFSSNASVVRDVALAVAESCPNALVNIITNPVNSCVPIFCEVMKKAGKLSPGKVFGISTLDLVRASKLIGDMKGLDPMKVNCPVIGGHSGITICPIVSQCQPAIKFSKEELDQFIHNVQNAGTHVVKAKAGAGSAQLAMAFAGARFAFSCLRAKKGESNIIECSYVMNDVVKTKYFSTKLLLGKNGVEKHLEIGKVTDYEQELINKAIPAIKKNVEKGEKFVG